MNYQVDVSYEYQSIKSKLFRLSLLFSLLLTLIIIMDVLLVVLTKEQYTVQLIVSIVITIVFVWFSIFFFSNIYLEVNLQYRYYQGYFSGLKPVDEVEFVKIENKLSYVNGLYVYPVYVRYAIGLNRIDKVIFAFNNDIDFEMGDSLTITTYQRILIKAEKHSWMP